MRARFLFLACSLIVPSVFAGDYYTATLAPKERTFNFSGAESQSAVVPPARKSQCPSGRFLVSDDNKRPPLNGSEDPFFTTSVVHWRNLSGTAIPSRGVSKFTPPPDIRSGSGNNTRPRRMIGDWSDHRLVSLPNGDLIYQRLMATREPMNPEPVWAPETFRGSFGPGARSTNTTWRSTDCGLTFRYVGQIDSFSFPHSDCAKPQPHGKLDEPPPGKFDMGGTDNPNLVVDRRNGTVYALLPCVGNELQPDALELTDVFVDRTYILSWKPPSPGDVTAGGAIAGDGDTTLFRTRGFYKPGYWGAPAVPLSPTRIAVAAGSGVAIGTTGSSDTFTFPEEMDAPPDVNWGWDNWDKPSNPALLARVGANIQGSTILANMPGAPGQLLLAFPAKVGIADGFRVYAYDPEPPKTRFRELDPIVPRSEPETSSVILLTAVDPGDNGPVLLYWTDLNGGTLQGRVHGRVIVDLHHAAEVPDITPVPFALTLPKPPSDPEELPQPYFHGDYRTAEGFKAGSKTGPLFEMDVYRYFPMWVQPWTENLTKQGNEPGGSVHYREVTVTLTTPLAMGGVVLTDKPPEQVFGECCDFLPLLRKIELEQGLTTFSHAGKTAEQSARLDMVKTLLEADPNLRDARLRLSVRSSPQRRSLPAVQVPAGLSPKARASFERHRRRE